MFLFFLGMLTGEGDRQAFLTLHSAYEKEMYTVAQSILHSRTLAEDAVQQSWVQIIRYFERMKEIPWDETKRYIVTIVKNTSLNLLRKERHDDPLPDDWDLPAPEGAADGRQALVDLIRSMPEQYRTLLELKFVLEWQNREIAAYLHMNESTVASRIARGRALLIGKLQEEGYCYE